jgi:outer membrane protein
LSLLASALMAEKLTIGAGPYMQTQPYNGVDGIILPTPVVFFDNSVVYARWMRAGVYFLGDQKEDSAWGFSLTAQPRINSYKASDSTYLTGMSDKRSTIEGGVAFSASKDKAYIEILALTDVLSSHNTWTLNTEVGYKLELGKFSIYPSLLFNYQSSKFINYYYGVTPSEATASRPAYSSGGALQIGAQTYIEYPITDKLSVFGNIRADRLPSEATKSPIVTDNYMISGLVSLMYTFEY